VICLVAVAVALAACGAPPRTAVPMATSPRHSPTIVPHPEVVSSGLVCGVTALGGGPPSAVGVKYRVLLHRCPSGSPVRGVNFILIAENGKRYHPTTYKDDGWMARLPVGSYRAFDAPGCSGPGRNFLVSPGKTTLGVVVWWGCNYY
jgi:hypothetical protein